MGERSLLAEIETLRNKSSARQCHDSNNFTRFGFTASVSNCFWKPTSRVVSSSLNSLLTLKHVWKEAKNNLKSCDQYTDCYLNGIVFPTNSVARFKYYNEIKVSWKSELFFLNTSNIEIEMEFQIRRQLERSCI